MSKIELIDFLLWYRQESDIVRKTLDPSNVVDMYLNKDNKHKHTVTFTVKESECACEKMMESIVKDTNEFTILFESCGQIYKI